MWDGAGMTTFEQMRACPASKFDEVLGNSMRQQKTRGDHGPWHYSELRLWRFDNVVKVGNEMDIPYDRIRLRGYRSCQEEGRHRLSLKSQAAVRLMSIASAGTFRR